MTILEQHAGRLARASKKTALISAVGALIVFASFAVGSYLMLKTLGDLDVKATDLKAQISEKQTLKYNLDKELQAKKQEVENVKRELDQQIRLANAARSEKDAAVAELQELNGELLAASTPKACQELQTVARDLQREAPPITGTGPEQARSHARDEWEAGLAVREKDPIAAEAHFRNAMQIDPTYAAPCNSLGRLKFDDKKADEAIALYRQALERSPTYTPAMYDLAIAYKRTGHPDALKYARMFEKLSPDRARARKLLEFVSAKRAEKPPVQFR
jgi:tetratricopeptide (TPR) repeat protein